MFFKSITASVMLFGLSLGSYAMQEYSDDQEMDFDTKVMLLQAAGFEGDELARQIDALLIESSAEQAKGEKSEEEPKELYTILSGMSHGYEGKQYEVDPGMRHILGLQPSQPLIFKNSSALHNNCLFFSIIRDDSYDLLTRILGMEDDAIQTLQLPEEFGRDFSNVRTAFLFQVYKNQDMQIERVGELPITVSDLLRSIMGNDKAYRTRWEETGVPLDTQQLTQEDINQYLGELNQSCQVLDETFAVIFSYIYEVPVYVLTPDLEGESSDTLVQSLTTRYYKMPAKLKEEKPIMIYHDGLFGIHYSKLEALEML